MKLPIKFLIAAILIASDTRRLGARINWSLIWANPDYFIRLQFHNQEIEKRPVIYFLARCKWASPFEFYGFSGQLIYAGHDNRWCRFLTAQSQVRAPFGGVIESMFRRRRRCVMCGKFFWRDGAFNPIRGVNLFEEHCSGDCAEDDLNQAF